MMYEMHGAMMFLKINEIILYAFIMYVDMMHEMLLECNFVLENKSLTSAGEFWEAEPRTTVGDEEYAHLSRPYFLECFCWGFLFCCLRRTPLGNIDFV